MPPILDGVPSHDTASGVRRLVERACFNLQKNGEWSLCELLPDDNDYCWLLEWASEVRARDLRGWLDSYDTEKISERIFVREAMIGLLLLLFASETARRCASEGSIWASVHRRFLASGNTVLFLNGQPTEQHKLALERAVRKFRLRNAFEESEKAWLITAYLQFGFSSRSIKNRLPLWIAGHPASESVQHLRGPTGSESFRAVWSALQKIRADSRGGKHVSLASLTVLRESPWLLATDHDAVVRAALAAARLIVGSDEQSQGVSEQLSLGNPHIHWDGRQAPVFHIPILGLAELDPEIIELDVLANNQITQRLIRNDVSWQGDSFVTIGAASDDIQIEIKSPDEENAVLASVVELWSPQVDICVFEGSNGTQVKLSGALRRGGYYIFALPTALELKPLPDTYFRVGPRNLHIFQSLPENVEILCAGECVWQPTMNAIPAVDQDTRVTIFLDPLKYPDSHQIHKLGTTVVFRLQIAGEVPIEIRNVNVNGIAAELGPFDAKTRTAILNVPVVPEIANKELVVTASISQSGLNKRVRISIAQPMLPVTGLVLRDKTGDHIVSASSILFSHQLPNVRPIFPLQGQNWRLFQDSSDKGNITSRIGSLSKVKDDAFGIGLCLEKGEWNHIHSDRIHLCSGVVNEGGIESFLIQNGLAVMKFKSPVDFDGGHKLLIWTGGNGISTLLRPSIDYDRVNLTWSWPIVHITPIAIGVGYHGKCTHYWFSDEIASGIESAADTEYLAIAIRWLGLPIGIDSIKRPLIRRIKADLVPFVRAWFFGRDDGELTVDANDPSWPHWNRVARILLRDGDWPGHDSTLMLIDVVGFERCADGLLRNFPQLFRRALVPYLSPHQILSLLERYSEVSPSHHADLSALRPEMDILCDIVAQKYEVDRNFISTLLQKIVMPDASILQRRNGDIALDGSQEFRRLFALRVLLNALQGTL